MQATVQDIPQLAQLWYESRSQTAWAGVQLEWSVGLCAVHLATIITDPDQYVSVIRHGKTISGACGVRLVEMHMPPYSIALSEWLWFGSKRVAVIAWQECVAWGKQQGAVYAQYGLAQPQYSSQRWTETHYWRVL